jgi:hypothetical protein
MAYKNTGTAFVSRIGRHSIKSLGKDLGLDNLLKHAKSGTMNSQSFGKASKAILNTQTLSDIGLRVGSGVVSKMIANGFNNVTNDETTKIPLLTYTTIRGLGKNTSTY